MIARADRCERAKVFNVPCRMVINIPIYIPSEMLERFVYSFRRNDISSVVGEMPFILVSVTSLSRGDLGLLWYGNSSYIISLYRFSLSISPEEQWRIQDFRKGGGPAIFFFFFLLF